jgi:hypothetical protein
MIHSLIGQTVTAKEHLMVKKRVALMATAMDRMKADQMAPMMEMLMTLPRN